MLQIGILQIVTPAEKKRNRNPLSLNWFDRRYAAKSQHGDYYQNQAGVVVTNEKAVRLHKHAKTSADFARRSIQYLHENSNNLELNGNDNNYVGSFKDRRVAIKYLFMQVFGAPDEEDWHEMKLVPAISHLLNISKNSHTTVLNTLHKIVASDIEYLGKVSLGQGRVALIQHGTEQSTIVCNALEQGLSSKETACLLNMYRERQEIPEEAVSRSAVQGFMQRSNCIKTSKIQCKKSGKDDSNCLWARARLEQATQFRDQLLLGFLDKDSFDVVTSSLTPIHIDGIVWWDEHHQKVILGSAGVYQHQISRNESGDVVSAAEGGVFNDIKTTTSIKYPGEGRGCFGVAIVTKEGISEGVRVVPFNYTGRKVVTEKAFQMAIDLELRRVLPLKNGWKTAGYGYKDRYGDRWEVEVRKEVNKVLCSVNDIIDHVITESTKIYAGTDRADTFFIFHDGLTVWWTIESQDYIESLGFRHRQLCCMGDTNKGNRYENKVVGDSPEICRGLDAYGFADFRRFIERMRALTSSYEMSNPKRFSFGTPTQVWDSMVRCWTMEPKSDRIIQDIEDFGNVLELIIYHKGSVVPECRLRHGHRQLSHNGGRVLKRKITNRQRKYLLTMGSIHPDAEDALEKLLTIGPTEGVLALAEIEEALGIEEEAFANIIDAEHDEEDDIPDDFDDFDEVP